MGPMKVVLWYNGGAVRKGYTEDFHPDNPTFHFHEDPRGSSPAEMAVDGLKALFVVRSFEGNAAYNERKSFTEEDKAYGEKVELTFGDGEVMQGSRVGSHPRGPGFLLSPPDPKSNNILVFAVSTAVKHFRFL